MYTHTHTHTYINIYKQLTLKITAQRDRERQRCALKERGVTISLIKDVSKTLIKTDYPHKRSTTCYLQLIYLGPLSQ